MRSNFHGWQTGLQSLNFPSVFVSPFAISINRMRFGIKKSSRFVLLHLSLPMFVEYRKRLRIAKLENVVFVWLYSHLSLSLFLFLFRRIGPPFVLSGQGVFGKPIQKGVNGKLIDGNHKWWYKSEIMSMA